MSDERKEPPPPPPPPMPIEPTWQVSTEDFKETGVDVSHSLNEG